jgi:hypothetical protein
MTMTGEPGAPPTRTGLSLVDLSAGFAASTAVLAGLLAAERTGRGGDYDVSLLDTALALEIYAATWHLSHGWLPERTRNSAHPSMVPFQNFPTADGWIVVCVAKESLFGRLCDALALPELVRDERFATFAARREHRDEVLEVLEQRFLADTTEHWLGVLRSAGIPCGPVNDLARAFEDPQVKARAVVVETDHPVLGTVRRVRTPVRQVDASRSPRAARSAASTPARCSPRRLRRRGHRRTGCRRRLRGRAGVSDTASPAGDGGGPGVQGVHHVGASVSDLGASLASGRPSCGRRRGWRGTLERPYVAETVGLPGIRIEAAFLDLPAAPCSSCSTTRRPTARRTRTRPPTRATCTSACASPTANGPSRTPSRAGRGRSAPTGRC